MFPLIDYSEFTDHQEDINVDNNNWIGCLYYGIKTVKSGKKPTIPCLAGMAIICRAIKNNGNIFI